MIFRRASSSKELFSPSEKSRAAKAHDPHPQTHPHPLPSPIQQPSFSRHHSSQSDTSLLTRLLPPSCTGSFICCTSLTLCSLFIVFNALKSDLQAADFAEQSLHDASIPAGNEGAQDDGGRERAAPFLQELSSSVENWDWLRLVVIVFFFVVATALFACCMREKEPTVLVVKADATLAQGLEVAQSEWRSVSARNGHVQPTLLQREWATNELGQDVNR